jgi:hypothetical protein
MTTAARLEQYNAFDQEVIGRVAAVADEQLRTNDHRPFITNYVLGDTLTENDARNATILDIRPREHDPKAALMIHLAMGQPLDPNNLYQIATIAAVNPNIRIITKGNPSGIGYAKQSLNREQREQASRGNFRPLTEPLMRFAEENGIESVDQYGYSFGADLAMTAASKEAFDTPHVIVVEPASVVKRSLIGLGIAFGRSNASLQEYVDQSGPAFASARTESLGLPGFGIALARLSNLAISRGLSQGGFELQTKVAMNAQPDMQTTITWGTDSELSLHSPTSDIVRALRAQYGEDRVQAIQLEGQKHALANDVYLQAALVAQGLRA